MLNALEPRTQALLLLVLPASLALAFTASVDCVMGDEDHGGYVCCCCIAALHLLLLLLLLHLLLHLLLLLLYLLLLLLAENSGLCVISADAAFAAAALPSLFPCCSCCSSLACSFFEINRVDKRKFKCACYLRAANKGSKEGSNKQERA